MRRAARPRAAKSRGPAARRPAIGLEQVHGGDARLGRLVQLYLHDWSAMIPLPIDEDASFPHDELPLYGAEGGRVAFLLRDEERRAPVGFALLLVDPTGCWHVEDFFVVAGLRRRGVGTAAARALFATRPGRWSLTVRPENPSALAFWSRVVPGARRTLETGRDGVTRTRLSFETSRTRREARGRQPPPAGAARRVTKYW
jgi:predicted acetyltransferase